MIFNPRVVQLTGARIALLPPSDLAASAGNTQVSLTWTDPGDETSGGQVVAEWGFTRIVRKAGSAPANQNDGVIVVDSTVKNQYLSEPFVDTGLTNGTTYYYGAFACSAAGAWSDGAFVSAVPVAGTPIGNLAEGTLITIKENGAPVEFYVADHDYQSDLNGNGRTLVARKYCYDQRQWGTTNNAWVNSSLQSWLNNEYKSKFSVNVQNLIGLTQYYYTPGNGNENLEIRSDAVFALSATELGQSASWFNEEGSIIPIANIIISSYPEDSDIYTTQWTRTPNKSGSSTVVYLIESGRPYSDLCTDTHGARPCFTLPSTALVDPSNALIES